MQVSQQSPHEVRMVLQQARLRPEPTAQPPPLWHLAAASAALAAQGVPEVAPMPPLPAINGRLSHHPTHEEVAHPPNPAAAVQCQPNQSGHAAVAAGFA